MPIERNFSPSAMGVRPKRRTALLLNPPVYDTQYWAEWSQPYGLLRIAALLKRYEYKKIDFFDFMEATPVSGDIADAQGKRVVIKQRIHCDESYADQAGPVSKARPYIVEKNGEILELSPDEIYISSVMSYWWESTRDLITRLRRLMGKKPKIVIGGIYPSIAPEHAERYTGADIVVAGEVEEANDLWTDLSVYKSKPPYSIITPSRGCPYNCHYCAAKTINGGSQKVRFRSVDDVYAEMSHKYESFGIRDFAFYADFLLIRYQDNLMPLLRKIVEAKRPWRLYAPEGLDTRFLAQSQELCDLLKAARFQKIYLPVENVDDDILLSLNRKHVKLRHVLDAVQKISKAGFRTRHMEVNGYCLYGLPKEKIGNVVETALFVSEAIGSIIPMLFAPVPSTHMFDEHREYFKERGWCEPDGTVRDLHLVNGKLYPFLPMNEGSINDYIELQRLMFMLNQSYRSKSFNVFGESAVAKCLRETIVQHENHADQPGRGVNGSPVFELAKQRSSLPVLS
jgi:radical SAM superfamily enzyme YgiQ (UPF0313 family)